MAKPRDGAETFWKAVHEAFDPIRPVTDPKLRVEREARYNPMVELDRRLRLPIGHMGYGVAGSVGSGKSTELLAAADTLTDDALVVFVDLWQHFRDFMSLVRELEDSKHDLPSGAIALTLLDKHQLLAYPNQSTWYLPHPVLMLKRLQRPQARRG